MTLVMSSSHKSNIRNLMEYGESVNQIISRVTTAIVEHGSYECDLVGSLTMELKILEEKVMEITDGMGADVVINATPASKTIEDGIHLLRKQGKLLIFGGLPKDNPTVNLDGNLLHYSEIQVIGGFSTTPDSFRKAFEVVAKGMINANLVSHILPLKDMEKGVKMLKSGEALKVVLKP